MIAPQSGGPIPYGGAQECAQTDNVCERSQWRIQKNIIGGSRGVLESQNDRFSGQRRTKSTDFKTDNLPADLQTDNWNGISRRITEESDVQISAVGNQGAEV